MAQPQRPHRAFADSLHTTAPAAALLSLAAHVTERLKAEWQIPTSSREIESWFCEWIALNRTPDGEPVYLPGRTQTDSSRDSRLFATCDRCFSRNYEVHDREHGKAEQRRCLDCQNTWEAPL